MKITLNHSNNTRQPHGFTVVEILIVIVVIGILAAITVGQFGNAAKKGRDSERYNDITALKSHLEEYYQDVGGYPSELSSTTLQRLNPDIIISPDGATLTNNSPVESEFVARQTTTPLESGPQYVYTAYPESCTTHCSGYILASFIELDTVDYQNPYSVSGTYNN